MNAANGEARSRRIGSLIVAGRFGLGFSLMTAPTLAARSYVGPDAARPSVRYSSRVIGGREVALATALLLATDSSSRRQMLMLGAAFDAWDACAALAERRGFSLIQRLLATSGAAAMSALGVLAAQSLRHGDS